MNMYQSDEEEDSMQVMQQAEEDIQLATRRRQRRKAILIIAVSVGALALLFGIFIDESFGSQVGGRSKEVATSTETPTSSPLVITPGCIPTDRFDNEFNSNQNNRLFAGQFICSDDDNQRYHFGLTSDNADLIWLDTATQESVTYAANPTSVNETDSSKDKLYYYLSVRVDGTFVLNQLRVQETNGNNNATVVWELKPKYPMDLSERCLTSSPQVHDCPYLHLHNDGVIVLNWINATKRKWETRNIKRAYDFPDL